MDILDKIVENKRREVAEAKLLRPLSELRAEIRDMEPCRGFRRALEASQTGIIAEFKRHSPSAGWINRDARPETVVPAYAAAGAACCSVLTDGEFFKGSVADFAAARAAAALPLLRKDFIIDEHQVYETRAMGADAMLLIASELEREQCAELAALARELGLDTILEVHGEGELAYLGPDISIMGVNNRHLGSFKTDVSHSFVLAEQMRKAAEAEPGDKPLLISESGIKAPSDVLRLREAGFRGFLIGGNFMKCADPAAALGEFINELQSHDN